MKIESAVLLSFLVFAPATSVSAADAIAVETRVDAVTVYADRA